MKRIFSWLAVTSIVMLLAGCFEVEMVIKVNPDGSGTIDQNVLVSNEVISQIEQMTKAFDPEGKGSAKPLDIFDPERLKQEAGKMGEGVTYLSGEKVTNERGSGYIAHYSFADLSKLKIEQQNQGMGSSMAGEQEGKDNEPITFKFIKGNPSKIIVMNPIGKAMKDTVEKEAGKAETLAKLEPKEGFVWEETETGENRAETPAGSNDTEISDSMPLDAQHEIFKMMKSLKIALALEVNGKIVETNATHRQGRRITFLEMDFSKMIDKMEGQGLKDMEQKFAKLGRMKDPKTLEEAKELMKQFPGMKMDLNEELVISFTK